MDLTNKTFGNLVVLGVGEYYTSPSGQKLKRWKCQCSCGNIINMTTSQLKRGQKSCGCISTREDLSGKKFGKLTVLYPVDDYISPKGSHIAKWHCQCECGKETDVLGMSLKSGDTKSCGCLNNKSKSNINKINPENFIGKKFGHCTVKSISQDAKQIRNVRFLCVCDCNTTFEISYNTLHKNSNVSCGCCNKKTKPKKQQKTNLVGRVFGDLTVIEELQPNITPNGTVQKKVKCRCSCGNIVEIGLHTAKKSLKCTECKNKERRVDITGQKFGKLEVVSMAADYISPSGHRLARCLCHCDCGKDIIVNMSGLVTGKTRSCGCISNTSGLLKDNEKLMEKYDFDKNAKEGIDLNTLTARSNTKVWWKCVDCGESWLAQIASQNDKNKEHGCPYCSGRAVSIGKNDLESQYPNILKEWDYEKNTIKPSEIHAKSGKKVWWKCSEGHTWQATVANRTYNNSSCPQCNLENINSFTEQAVFYYILKAFPDAINSDKHIGMELDIFIPSINVAIEYDGEAWHNSNKKIISDTKKNKLCVENDIELIRIREPKCASIDNCTIFVRSDSNTNKSLSNVIVDVLKYLNVNTIDVDIERDNIEILSQFATKKHNNSLLVCHPEIASEWHPTKNGTLTPDKVNRASRSEVWWLGKCGHEWKMSVSDRTVTFTRASGKIKKQYNCPYCSGRRVLIGFNDFASRMPNLVKEWHPTKNGDLKPTDVTFGSNKLVWWKCEKGHEWQQKVNYRYQSPNHRCPICKKIDNVQKVYNIELKKIFNSIEDAAKHCNCPKESISRVCRGLQKTSGGYHWEFYCE